ncbi:MAG: ABC transporter permease [Bacillota bacterium]
MQQFVIRRVLLAIPTILAVMIIVFLSIHLAPGDPVDQMIPPDMPGDAREEAAELIRQQYGLDQPLHIQFYTYLTRVLRLDFGRSLRHRTEIREDLKRRIPNTLQLGILALIISVLLGVGFGIVSAVRRDSVIDNVVTFGALFGVSMPNFFFGFILMLLFGLHLRWLPPSGFGNSILSWEGLRFAIMPALTLGTASSGVLARFTRSSMLDVTNEDYVRTARAKGLSGRVVIFRHALRNALIPVITLLGIQFGAMLSGSVITETVFSWPGVGRYLIQGISTRDYPVVQGATLVISVGFVLANFLTDLAYGFIDPRIRYE